MRKAHGVAVLVVTLLGIGLFFDLAAIGSGFAQLSLLKRAASGEAITPEEAASNDSRHQGIGLAQGLVFVITAICFLVWINRAYKHLKIVGKPSERFTPGWAVGYWFIPFLNFVRPYQIMKE